MNIMKKFWGSGGSTPEDPVMSQQIALSLTHLRKLYAEYVRPPQPLTEPEREAKLYSMLPLFCKVFAGSSGQEIWDRFPQCVQLSEFATKLMVAEIRRRAFNENTALASCEIISYLEMGGAEESSNGWTLLNTLNLLSSAGPTVVQSMVAAALPSTLVKCLYLFFDLPELGTDVAAGTEITPQESRSLLQKVFVQLMSRLCTSPCAADELARRDDLSLLFSAMTSSCPPHNVSWRKSASEVLMALSRNGLSQNTVTYIHDNGCVSLCVENMRSAEDLPPLEMVEMFVSLFCFLKDSADVSQVLLADLRSSQGYIFLGEFLLRLEQDTAPESTDAARNLVLLLASLAMCGHTELQPSQAAAGTPFKLSGFSVPQPSGLGTSVRNVHAFHVLQTVFLRATSCSLCCVILDTISSVYHADRANYFILESQHTISQFAEKIHLKPKEAQDKFFQLLELVVFQLNYVPVKELISCSILLKQHCSLDCSQRCMESLLSILRFSPLFKDVYREVGILEVLVQCLARYADLLKSRRQTEEDGDAYDLPEPQSALGRRTMETFTVLLAGSAANAAVFRESGGSQRVHEMLVHPDCSQQALGILQQLMLCAGGESEMGSLLAFMENAPFTQISLKIDILKSVLGCLRDSHRSRTMFRRVGGFVYVMAVLVSLEGCMAETPEPPWDAVPRQTMLSLVHGAFNTLTMAMRYEPANAKFFQLEICSTSLLDTVRLLGCFGGGSQLAPIEFSYQHTEEHTFQSIFASDVTSGSLPPNVPLSLSYACLTLRLLYDMALDSFDKPAMAAAVSSGGGRRQEEQQDSAGGGKRRAPAGLNLSPPPPEPLVVHAGVVVEMLHLLPAIHHAEQQQMAVTLQVYLAEILKSLMRSERNQQVMCDAGFPGELLSTCRLALEDEHHLLHPAIQYMLERLAAQTLEPRDLRSFLRLGSPLMCAPVDEPPSPQAGGAVSLTRVKTLVSMTTPRDCRHGGAAILPPFVEFDMSVEGFGCLFLPSLAPQCLSVGDTSVLGGIGTGDRVFPPATGLTYSTWFNVERYSNSRADPHCVRLLTLVRHPHGRDQQLICLTIVLSARDKALIISTRETEMPHHGAYDWEPECRGDASLRVWCPDLLEENQWHHLLVTLNRAVLKHSACAVYIDGKQVANQKLHYISQNPGGGAANLTSSAAVYGFLGTPPQWRRHSKLVWKQGACLLLEEALTPAVVGTLYRLGPNYLGTLQAPFINGECCSALVPEERVVLGLNAMATSQLTLAKIRKVYSKTDNRSIAKQLGMSSHENATPIRILHNAGGHLSGPARTLGGVVIGYLGVRVFCARPVARMVENVGSTSLVLGLIALATDVEALYAGVKALTCVVKTNRAVQLEMDRCHGYQLLAMLLKQKRPLLNSHILHLVFGLVGTVDARRETSSIPNVAAFTELLCDLTIWNDAPAELSRSLYEHLLELVTESSEARANLTVIRDVSMTTRLLQTLRDCQLPRNTQLVVLKLLSVLLMNSPRRGDVVIFGQFLAGSLPAPGAPESGLELTGPEAACSADSTAARQTILLRNKCLQIVANVAEQDALSDPARLDEWMGLLGYDWLLLFLQGHLHQTTVVLAAQLLFTLLCSPSLLARFRDGGCTGGWLQQTESVIKSRLGAVLGYHMGDSVGGSGGGGGGGGGGAGPGPTRQETRGEPALQVPGFQQLSWLLPKHTELTEISFMLLQLLLGQPVRAPPQHTLLTLDTIWLYVCGIDPASGGRLPARLTVIPEALTCLLEMVRAHLNYESTSEQPLTMLQFVLYLYHHCTEMRPVLMSADVLTVLAGTLFPYRAGAESSPSTPLDEAMGLSDAVLVSGAEASDAVLTSHPASKYVLDLLRIVTVDSLSLAPSKTAPPLVDILLEVAPDNTTLAQQMSFQTKILSLLMDHLTAADVLIGEQAALPISPGGSVQNVPGNVFYFAGRLVDKLWQGIFKRDAHEVLDFIIKLISQARRWSQTLALDSVYHCLNRAVLYILSRPTDSVAEQLRVLEALHTLTNHRSLVFGSGNHDSEFFGALVYCLLQLTGGLKIIMESESRTIWHAIPTTLDPESSPNTAQGHNLMANAARRVWSELYIWKRPAVEEVFKVSLPLQNNTAPDLDTIRPTLQEAATRLWVAFLDGEKKCSYRPPWEIQAQLQTVSSKLQRVTGGLSRLAQRTRSRREDSVRARPSSLTAAEVDLWTLQHIGLVRESVVTQFRQFKQSQKYMEDFIMDEWLRMERELTRERGLWGPEVASSLDKWQLDTTEGPCRMRKRTVSDVSFYQRYPYRPDLETVVQRGAAKYKVPVCRDSRAWAQQRRRRSLLGRSEAGRTAAAVDTMALTEEEGGDCADIGEKLRQAGLRGSLRRRRLTSDPEEEPESLDLPDSATDGPPGSERPSVGSMEDTSPDNQTLLRLLEHGEKISHMYRCARIQGLDTVEGLLLFGRDHVYVVDGFTMLKTREIRDISNLPANMHDPIVPCQPTGRRVKDVRSVSKVAYDDIREVLKRRYLLQPIAVEFFSADGRNYLLAFPIKTRNKIYQRLQSVATSMADTQESVAGQKTSANVDQSGGLLSSLMGDTSVTQRWVRGEMSNFQYLMHLNSLAGRSYNDLMQYPVFPWVLKDYSADKLDLADPSTFRDLARPMGAQTPKRLHQFEKRYREWDDPTGETPPYHYGTHYSSAMIVCSYLVRLEPFSTHFLRLQGGHFDLADRMFHSVEDAWRSASEHNMADVRELIPEFFYLPEFLTNANRFDLGHKQNGTALDDVVLPAWAKGDPREFIRVHREALECPYVSSHLHHWIDLIFGCKQQGHGAVDAYNVFHYLFYEGNVDIFSIEDPLKKTATVGFINNFGQIPRQLFKKPHPQRRLVGSSLQPVRLTNRLLDGAWQQSLGGGDKLFFHGLDSLRPSMQPVKELKGPIGHIVAQDRSVLAVEQNKYIVPGNSGRYVAWGFADHSVRVGSYETDRASLVAELVYSGEVLCCLAPRPKLIVTGGTSTVVVVYEYGKRRLQVKARLCGHTEAVLSLAASTAYSLIVSGSRDGTCIVWDLFRLTYVRQLRGHSAPVAAVAINDVTGDIATSSGTWLHVWTVNGAEVARVNTAVGASDRMQQILCLGFSQSNEWDADNVIMTGSTDGVVRMWSLDYVQVPVASSSGSSPDSGDSERSLPDRLRVTPGQRSSKADEIVRKMSLVSGELSPQGPLPASVITAAAGGGITSLAGRCVALLPDALREDVRDVVDAVRRASLAAPVQGAAVWGSDPGSVLLRSGSESSLSDGGDGSDEDVRSSGTGGSTSRRSSRRPSVLRRQQAVTAGSGAHTVQLSAALEALASVSSCEEADQSPGVPTPPPAQGPTGTLTANKAHSLESAPEQPVVRRQKSEHNTQEARKSTGDRLLPPGAGPGEMRCSKSDTNLAAAESGFVVVTEADLAPPGGEKRRLLRDGFRWQCQLVFRSKLTMHTAYDRRDNAEPASVTALAVSKDHRTVYVGDSRGRVWAWNVSDSAGPSDHWRRDDSALVCASCSVKFSVTERKHHCRNCGEVFCAKCSHHESEIIRLRILKPVRVCQRCFDLLRPH